ncbi:MAG: peptidoglycan-binding protein, partial [Clostridia bacterium]|nr:peptidoglycan-binding protein [Clostridia bacterium]
GTGNVQQNGTISSTNAALNGEYVDYNTTIIPYAKPTGALNPGDKSDGVKWLQWILIYTECGLQNPITGDYDDATATAVKTLQLKYGMTVDGIASNEVIEKAEQMYNDYINGISGQNTSSPAVFNTVGNTNPQGDKKQAPDITVTVIIVVLVIVWIFAIAAVFIIVHIKRKNITLSEDGEIVKPEKERRKKNTRRTRELTDSVELKPSATLISLADDEEVDDNSVKSLFDRRKDELISKPETDDNTNEVQQKETVSQEVTKSDKVSETQIDDATTEENLVEVEAAEEKGNVSVEEQTSEPEQETVVETEQEQVSVEEPIKEQDTETPKDSEKVTFEVVDVPVNFNSFNEFDYSDDAEIKPSLSLHEMKQRKKKLEEEARKNIVNSSDSK